MKKHNYIALLCLLSLLCISFSSKGQDEKLTMKLSLDDVLLLAKNRSPQSQVAKFKYLESYWEFKSYQAEYLPYLEANATLPSYTNQFQNVTQQDGTQVIHNINRLEANAGLSLNQRIPFTDGLLSVSTGLSRTEDINSDTPGEQFISNPVFVSYTQKLFGFNDLKWRSRINPTKYEYAKRLYLEEMEDVNMIAVNYYFNLLQAQVNIDIAQKNISNYDTLFQIAKGRYELGKIAENDLLQLELRVMTSKLEYEESLQQFDNSVLQLKSFLRIKDDQDIVLELPIPEDIKPIPLDKVLVEAAANTSIDRKLRLDILNAEKELARRKYSERYSIDLKASYGINAEGANLEDSYRDFSENQTASLGLNIPILNWGRNKGQIKMAEANLDMVRTNVEQEKITNKQSIILDVNKYNMQKIQLDLAAKSDTIAKLRYDITQKRYLIGKINDITELNQAQVDNDASKLKYISALRNYWEYFYKIRKITLYDFEQDRIIYVNLNDLY